MFFIFKVNILTFNLNHLKKLHAYTVPCMWSQPVKANSKQAIIDPAILKMQIRAGYKAGEGQTGNAPMQAENDRPPTRRTTLGNGFYGLKNIEID